MRSLIGGDFALLNDDRAEIADVFYRYAEGLDNCDAEALASAFTEDCVADFGPAAARLGMQFPPLNGRAAIVNTFMALIGPLDTSHSVFNLRISVNGDTATTKAQVLGQHFLPNEGAKGSQRRHVLMMNRYKAELARTAEGWRINRLVVDNLWSDGDPTIIVAMTQRPSA